MAESVDALVSNTSGATHPGSIPGLGTKKENQKWFSFFRIANSNWQKKTVWKFIQTVLCKFLEANIPVATDYSQTNSIESTSVPSFDVTFTG